MKISKSILILSVALMSAGCATWHVTDNDVMKPDRLSGYRVDKPFDQAALHSLMPDAVLATETLDVAPDVRLGGLRIIQPQAVATVLYFPGGGDHIDNAVRSMARLVANCPVNLLMFDYRGFGRSNGEHSAETLKSDSLKIYDHYLQQTQGHLFVHGYSMGSFMTAYLAQQRQPQAIILQATASSMQAAMLQRLPSWVQVLMDFRLSDGMAAIDNLAAVSKYTHPALVIAGTADTQTPENLGRQVFDALPSARKHWVSVPGGTHTNLLQSTPVKTAYCDFIRQNAQPAPAQQ
ncbi:alpha/beta hydrolase [Undibacterium luofuense]|uniref:Alpha/beta fold hydrolase n=1 Tax=Undibacterium luofuense TaxID=2828733 RepID=A0A941DPE9_9BURK|nr:alpha/beta fold hydrolase [Undibacterium luofuense]MBR7783630.1 alpha/beta fold hydrolase [Undibacterium luofuense]